MIVLLGSFANAATLKILEAERLELRNENGEELVILVGKPVKLDRDGELIEAARVVFNRTQKRLMLMGGVRYRDKNDQLIEAAELELDTSDESFEAIEVKIESGEFYLTGPVCQRAAGQILLQEGYLTPCQRCEQDVNDYAFRAKEVLLYPGDRIIARDVWVLVKEEPVFYLPVMLLYLNERRPKLELGQDATDGFTAQADLPYVTQFGLGFTLLRFFENRGWGAGFDHFGAAAAKERYQFLYLPAPVGAAGQADSNPAKDGIFIYSLSYDLTEPDWRYQGLIRRNDAGGVANANGVPAGFGQGGSPDLTSFRLEASQLNRPAASEPQFRFLLEGYIDHNPAIPNPQQVQRLPEVEMSFPKGIQGEVSLSGRVLMGFYSAPSNTLNRSAREQPTVEAGKLLVEHNSAYRPATPLWPGLTFSIQNRFVGNYYTSQNPPSAQNPEGEYERLIVWSTQANAQQVLGPFSLGLSLSRSIVEGETPFAFDFQRPSRRSGLEATFAYTPGPDFSLTARVSRDLEAGRWEPAAVLTLTGRPFPWMSVTTSVSRDLENGRWGLWRNTVNVTPAPLNLSLNYERQLELGLDRQLTASLSYTPLPFSVRASTGYRWTDVAELETRPFDQIRQINRFDDLVLGLSYTPSPSSVALEHTRDLNNDMAIRTRVSTVVQEGATTFSLEQSFTHLYFTPFATTQPYRLDGSVRYTSGLHSFAFTNNVFFGDDDPATRLSDEGVGSFSLSYTYAANTTLRFSGRWNFVEDFFIAPELSISTTVREPQRVFTLSANYHFAERNDPVEYLRNLNFQGELELVPAPLRLTDPPGVGLQGTVSLARRPDGRFGVQLREFGPTFSFLGAEQTRLFLRILYNSDNFVLPNLENAILKPKFVITVDRCCWALRTVLDVPNNSFKISFLLGGESADFLLGPQGIRWPWDQQTP